MVTARSAPLQRPGLHSASTTDYIKPRLSTKFREHAFSYAGPHARNNLPDELRQITKATTFKKHLKAHFLLLFVASFVFRQLCLVFMTVIQCDGLFYLYICARQVL